MSKHTPGPWRVCGGMTPKYTGIVSDKGYIVFEMGDYSQQYENDSTVEAPGYIEQRANADLIAAAPELLEALEELMGSYKSSLSDRLKAEWFEEYRKAEAAVKKAKGE